MSPVAGDVTETPSLMFFNECARRTEMNRRQLIRNGLVAVGGMTAGASGVLRSELVLAQTQPLPHPTRPPQPIRPISPAKIWSPAIPTSKSVEEMTVGFGLSPKGSVTVATVKATDAVKKLPNMVPISASRAILISTNPDVPPVAKEEIPNQFFAFQAAFLDGSPTVLTPNDVEPSIQTGETAPDVLLDVSLASFHLSESDGVNKDARAQLRLTINNEADTERARKFDIVYWAITTGLYLFDDQLKTRIPKLNSSDLKADFRKALGNRSIELPGGIGSIKFEVIRHKEPPWWRKIFTFGSEGGKALTAVLGFPECDEGRPLGRRSEAAGPPLPTPRCSLHRRIARADQICADQGAPRLSGRATPAAG